MKKSDLMSGAITLSVGSVLAKLFSAIYRIVLTRILGGVGIGLYQLIFPFYSLCVVFATAGLPMAISKVISKHSKNEKEVIKKCLMFTSIVALFLTFILFISSNGLATLQGQKQLSTCYMILAPTIILVSVSSVLRGYFQGKHNFTPSSVSNVIEQFIKMIVGLVLSLSLISVSLFAAIVGAIVGIVMSEIISLLVLILFIKKEKISSRKKTSLKIKDITKDILPITLSNIILPISSFVDSVLVVNLLSVNYSNELSVFLYGLESGAVSSLMSLPTIFSFAIASVILPNITTLKHWFNKNYKLTLAIKLVILIAVPCVVCFTLVPNRLISFIYHNKLTFHGVNGIEIASRLLSISGFGIVFLAINQVYSSCLQAVDERYVAIRNLTIAVVLKFVIQIIFMPSKILNIYALAVANTVCYITVMILNHVEIKQHFKISIHLDFWVKMIFSNCVMIFCLITIMSFSVGILNTLLSFLLSIIVYLACLFITGIFTKKDKAMIKYKV